MRARIIEASAFMADRPGDLSGQFFEKAVDHVADMVRQRKGVNFLLAEITGKKNILEFLKNLDHGFLRGNHDSVVMGNGAFFGAALHDFTDHPGEPAAVFLREFNVHLALITH
jgi:hypothetical protein